MKKKIIGTLKIIIPLFLGLYLCWYFWDSFTEEEKTSFLLVFKETNYFILSISFVIGFLSHFSRAVRWKLMLHAMDYKPTLLNTYNAVMIGYIANLALPRVGEAIRAGTIRTTDNIPFEKGFGTVVAERLIDMVCLVCIIGIAIAMNYSAVSELIKVMEGMSITGDGAGNKTTWLKYTIFSVIAAGVIASVILYLKKPAFKAKVKRLVKGFWDGLKTIFTLEKRGWYLFHTAFIWCCYIAMFWITFYAWPGAAHFSPGVIMSCFVMGTIGFIIVQGGVGTYQLLLAITLTFFAAPEMLIEEKKFLPEMFGFANLMWLGQTLLIIVLGLIALLMVKKGKPIEKAAD